MIEQKQKWIERLHQRHPKGHGRIAFWAAIALAAVIAISHSWSAAW
jgi:hypothetical protein